MLAQKIRSQVQRFTPGKAFSTFELSILGPRNAIDQALCRMVQAGEIERLARGVFTLSKKSAYVKSIKPSIYEIVSKVAEKQGHRIQYHGAELARKYGLTSQMPTQEIFITNGISRTINVGKKKVRLQHVANKKLGLPGSKAGEVMALLWYLGKENVNTEVLFKIKSHLTESDHQELLNHMHTLPHWMIQKLSEAGWSQ